MSKQLKDEEQVMGIDLKMGYSRRWDFQSCKQIYGKNLVWWILELKRDEMKRKMEKMEVYQIKPEVISEVKKPRQEACINY